MVPANPIAVELAGVVFDIIKLAETVEKGTVLTDGLPEGSRRTKTLSEPAMLLAVGNSDTFLLLSAI